MENNIKIGQSVENITEEERKKIRLSFDPDKMGFEQDKEEEGINYED